MAPPTLAPPPLPPRSSGPKPAASPVPRTRPKAAVPVCDEAVDLFWRAQLEHGYCPPEQVRFNRPAPPTTFPGRDPRSQG